MTYFLDTNICIYYLKATFPSIRERLERLSPAVVKIPAIVKAELLFGAMKSSRRQKTAAVIEQFLFPYEVIPFCANSAAHYADIRSQLETAGQIIGPNDLIVAATVLANSGTLITHNTDEFKRVKNLSIEDWTKDI